MLRIFFPIFFVLLYLGYSLIHTKIHKHQDVMTVEEIKKFLIRITQDASYAISNGKM